MTERILFLHPNQIDDATLSGGSWETDLPLTEIQDPILGHRARSTSLATSDTVVDIDLPRSVQIKGVAVIGHNIRTDATWQVEAFSDSARTSRTYNGGSEFAWVAPDNANRRWDADNYFDARPDPDEVTDINWPLVHPITTGHDARYWRLSFDDSANAAGYIEIGRIVIAYGWQPPVNFADGAGEGWRDDSSTTSSISGVEFHRERKAFRRFRGSIQLLEKDQAFGRAHELLRRAKQTKEVFVIPEPDDPRHLNRRSMLGRMTDLSPLERQLPDFSTLSFAIKELR